MSRAVLEDIKCCKCGEPNKFLKVYSESFWGYEFGNYYLNLERVRNFPLRDPMLVRECPKCGYINPNLSEDNGLSLAFIRNLTTEGYNFKSKFSTLFYKYYRMLLVLGKYNRAYSFLLDCLEECDYEGDTQGALFCIMKMVETYDMLESCGDREKMIHIDSLRRLGFFSETKTFMKNVEFSKNFLKDKYIRQVLEYQTYLAENYKDGIYTFQDMKKWAEEKDC